MAALVIAAAALALGYQSEVQASASTYVLLPGEMRYERNKHILYWNTTQVAKAYDETEVELIWIERMRRSGGRSSIHGSIALNANGDRFAITTNIRVNGRM